MAGAQPATQPGWGCRPCAGQSQQACRVSFGGSRSALRRQSDRMTPVAGRRGLAARAAGVVCWCPGYAGGVREPLCKGRVDCKLARQVPPARGCNPTLHPGRRHSPRRPGSATTGSTASMTCGAPRARRPAAAAPPPRSMRALLPPLTLLRRMEVAWRAARRAPRPGRKRGWRRRTTASCIWARPARTRRCTRTCCARTAGAPCGPVLSSLALWLGCPAWLQITLVAGVHAGTFG